MKKIPYARHEQGAALIFVLGVLALLMLMGVAFLSSMLLQRQTAETISRRYDVDSLAMSATNRALALMRLIAERIEDGDTSGFTELKNFSMVVSASEDGGYANGGSAKSDLEVDVLYDDDIPTRYPEPEWILVREGGSDDEKSPIVGRFAFAVVPDIRPQINLNAAWGKDSDNNGKDYKQIAVDTDAIESEDLQANVMSYKEAEAALKLVGSSLSRDKIRTYLTVGNPASIDQHLTEYYWIDDNGDGMVQKDELFRRFNLDGMNDHNALNPINNSGYNDTVAEDLLHGVNYGGRTDSSNRAYYYSSTGKFDDSSDNRGVALDPFFNKFTSSDKGTFSDLDDFKLQIVANMVDYTAPVDNKVTSNVNPDVWGSGSNAPKYTGNKKTCYINEVGGVFSGKITVGSSGGLPTARLEVAFTPYCEIVDIYGGRGPVEGSPYRITVDYTAAVRAEIKSTGTGGSSGNINDSQSDQTWVELENETDWENDLESLYGSSAPNNSHYYVGKGSSVSLGSATAIGGSIYDNSFRYNVEYVSIKINWVKLERKVDGKYTAVDFAHVNKTYDKNSVVEGGDSVFTVAATFQTEDPRQNLNPGDWQCHGIEISSQETIAANDNVRLGRQNVVSMGGDDADSDGSTVAGGELSTAYIHEGNFNSLWELGAISRGKKWQTINLKKANSKANGVGANGGDYKDGDAELLDFVYKDTGNDYNVKFNINARDIDKRLGDVDGDDQYPWEAFFNQIEVGKEYNSSSTSIGGAGSNDDSVEFFTYVGSWEHDDEYVKSRSEIADLLCAIAEANGATTDAGQESLYGKAANLLEASNGFSQPVKLLVIAQTIRDVGGSDGNAIELTALTKQGKSVTKDCKIGEFDSKEVSSETVYFDQITSTEKLLVTIQRNLADGSFIITSIDSLED